ncbi:MAG: MATE family efflux transporter [Eubacteriaceae bacterium]
MSEQKNENKTMDAGSGNAAAAAPGPKKTAVNPRTRMLGEERIGPLLMKLAVPAILSQVVMLAYGIINNIFVGHIPEVGTKALAAVGVCTPVLTIIAAAAMLLSVGGAPRASMALARGEREKADEILSNSFQLMIIISVIFTIVFVFFAKQILMMIGANEDTLSFASNYLQIYGLGTVFVVLTYGLNIFIMAQGYTKIALYTNLIAAVVNIALDPIMIYVFHWGVAGIAIASILGQVASASFAIRFLRSKKALFKLNLKWSRVDWPVLTPCLILGLSPFIMAVSSSITAVNYNSSLLLYGGNVAVGTYTIMASILNFMMLPLQGLTQGAQPITSFNFGAKNVARVKETFHMLLIWCMVCSGILWIIIELFPGLFVGVFTSDPALVAYAQNILRIFVAMFGFFGIQMACQYTLIAIDEPKISLFLAVFRNLIVMLPMMYLLPHLFDNKAIGVFCAEPVADGLATIVTAMVFFFTFRKAMKKLTASRDLPELKAKAVKA